MEEKLHSIKIDPKTIQMLKLVDKDFKTTVNKTFKELTEVSTENENYTEILNLGVPRWLSC